MFTLPFDPYKVLGMHKDARTSDIRAAYRRLILIHHPDRVFDDTIKAEKVALFHEIQKAYEILSDQSQRKAYDDKVQANVSERRKIAERRRRDEEEREEKEKLERLRSLVSAYLDSSEEDYSKTPRMGQLNRGHQTRRQKTQIDRKQPALHEDRATKERQPGNSSLINGFQLHDQENRCGHNNLPGKSRLWGKGTPGILVVHGFFEEQNICAIPDTGAEYNIISGSFVDELQLRNRIKRPITGQPLRMANGQYTFTSGALEANWRFGDDTSRPCQILFHILEDFVHDLILGNSFLMETQTMSYKNHRLDRIPRPMNALSVLRVNLLGVPSQRLRGFVDDAETLAFPDSGSEPNLVSLEFIWAQGWEHKMNTYDRRLLQFADGSTTKSEGSIGGSWRFVQKGNRKNTSVLADFHILRGCVHDVIIGQDVLEETDAFLEYEDEFVYSESTHSSAAMNLVWFASRKAKKAPPPLDPDLPINLELQRRALADQSIRRLPLGSERDKARREEEANRQLFDQQQEIPRSIVSPSDFPNSQSSNTSPLPRIRPLVEIFAEQEQESEREFNGGQLNGRTVRIQEIRDSNKNDMILGKRRLLFIGINGRNPSFIRLSIPSK